MTMQFVKKIIQRPIKQFVAINTGTRVALYALDEDGVLWLKVGLTEDTETPWIQVAPLPDRED